MRVLLEIESLDLPDNEEQREWAARVVQAFMNSVERPGNANVKVRRVDPYSIWSKPQCPEST